MLTDFDKRRANHLVNSWPGAKDWCEWDGEQWPCEWVQLYDELVRLRTEAQGFRTYDNKERAYQRYHARGGPQ